MSLPSIPNIALQMGIDLTCAISPRQQEAILVEAMRQDLGPALERLHQAAHVPGEGSVEINEDPASPVGKMLIRICAGDVLRKLAMKHFCHKKRITFFNCCKIVVGKPPAGMMLMQIKCQDGQIGIPDC